jgi:hypothetical protein
VLHKFWEFLQWVINYWLLKGLESMEIAIQSSYLLIELVGVATINVRFQMLCTFIDTHCKYITCIMWSLRRSSWCYWSAFNCDGRATVAEVGWRRCCLKECWECLLFTGARSMGRAVQWSPMKPESLFGWFPLKSSPTCSYRWLHCDLQNVPRTPEVHCSNSIC